MTKRSRGELKRLAREFLLGNYTIPMVAMLTASILPAVILAPFSIGLTAELDVAFLTYAVAAVILEILGQLLRVGVMRMHLLLAQKQKFSYMDLFWAFKNQPDRWIIATALLYAILSIPAVLAGLCIFFLAKKGSGFAYALMAAAIVVFVAIELYLIYMFGLIYLLYMERPEMAAIEGFRASAELMRGNKKRLFILQLSFVGWRILGFFSVGIGLLWIGPYRTQTMVNFYLDLTGGFDTEKI